MRTIVGAPRTGFIKLSMFWFFTFFGLTVPFRIMFSRYCDELCVTLVKETSAAGAYPKKTILPKLWSSKTNDHDDDSFIKNMKEFSLYNDDEANDDHVVEIKDDKDDTEDTKDKLSPSLLSKPKTSKKSFLSKKDKALQSFKNVTNVEIKIKDDEYNVDDDMSSIS